MVLVYMWRVILKDWKLRDVPEAYQARVWAELKKRNYDSDGNR